MRIEQGSAAGGVELKVYMEKPRIDDTGWPYFTVTHENRQVMGKWLDHNSFQLGNSMYYRLPNETWDEAVQTVFLEWVYTKRSPVYAYA